jgi:dUTP pyrophosphatase
MQHVDIAVKRLEHGNDLPLPQYETDGSAGMDLRAAVGSELTIAPSETVRVPTGLSVAIPYGFEGQVRPRSGLAGKSKIIVPNSPGTIDSDYRGEVQILLTNLGQEPFIVDHGMRIAQLVIAPVVRAEWVETDELPSTERGEGGFGHTGS